MVEYGWSNPYWHSILFLPAHIERFIKKAPMRGAHAIQIDLEDAVAYSQKETARHMLADTIPFLVASDVDIIVRVNRELGLCVDDLRHSVKSGVKAITIPKVMGADHVCLIDEMIGELKVLNGLSQGAIGLIAMIETLEGLENVQEIAKSCPRLIGLAFGSEDFSLDAGYEPTYKNLFSVCQQIIHAAHLVNKRAYGFPDSISNIADEASFKKSIIRGKEMGFDGAFCVHPLQVEKINEVYRITREEAEQAERLVKAFDKGIKDQLGAIEHDGKMIDLPVAERARAILQLYQDGQ